MFNGETASSANDRGGAARVIIGLASDMLTVGRSLMRRESEPDENPASGETGETGRLRFRTRGEFIDSERFSATGDSTRSVSLDWCGRSEIIWDVCDNFASMLSLSSEIFMAIEREVDVGDSR